MRNFISFLGAIIIITTINVGRAQNEKFSIAKYQVQGNGIPAKPKQITYKQPDGSVIHIYLKGDRVVHWAVSEDGYTILSNPNGFYEYAIINDKGILISSKIVAHDKGERKPNENVLLSKLQKGLIYSEKQIEEKLLAYKSIVKNSVKSFPSTGTQNNLVFMIQFSDLAFSNTLSDVDNLMNKVNYGDIGSFRDYYYQNSYEKLTVNTTVDGIYTAPKTHNYYGQNDGNGHDMYTDELFSGLISAADSRIDFSQYDNDKDGFVDCVYLIYAGTGEASSGNPNDIWPHNNPGITPITVDGVTINAYTCSNELSGSSLVGIGTICHEFGHALGLPDFYDTDYAGSGGQAEGTGSWDVMGNGSYNGNEASPATHNPLSKYLLSWQSLPTVSANGSYLLPPSENDTLVGWLPSKSSNEAFILENRQNIGFDYALPSHGMLIYHLDIDYVNNNWNGNKINANPNHQGFDIEEADNETTSELGDTYPGTTNNTSFTDGTFPNSLLWTGANLGNPIVNISENSITGNVTFNISGFVEVNDLQNSSNIKIFPTIANEYVEIKSTELINDIEIMNSQGQLISKNIINNLQTKISVSQFNSGIYFFKARTSNQFSVSKIIIIH